MTERPDPLAPPPGYGQKAQPARDPDWAGGKNDSKCAANRQSPESPPVCQQEHEYILYLGDVAEHIAPVGLCALHALEALRRLAAGQQAWCNVCRNKMRLEKITDIDGNEVRAQDVKTPTDLETAAFIQGKLDLLLGRRS